MKRLPGTQSAPSNRERPPASPEKSLQSRRSCRRRKRRATPSPGPTLPLETSLWIQAATRWPAFCRRLLKKRERWAFVALPLRYVSVVSDGKTMTAEAVFSDVADVLGGAGNKLKESGWQKSPGQATGPAPDQYRGGPLNRNAVAEPEGQGVLRDERHEPVVADILMPRAISSFTSRRRSWTP